MRRDEVRKICDESLAMGRDPKADQAKLAGRGVATAVFALELLERLELVEARLDRVMREMICREGPDDWRVCPSWSGSDIRYASEDSAENAILSVAGATAEGAEERAARRATRTRPA